MEQKDFSESDWKSLQFGPFWAYIVVGAQDGKLDERESAAFQSAVLAPGNMQGALGRNVLASLAADPDGTFQSWKADDRSPADGLKAIVEILAKVNADEATRYKGTLVWLAVKVAASSGSWLGDKIGDQERSAVMILANILAYDQRDAVMATTTPMVLDALPR